MQYTINTSGPFPKVQGKLIVIAVDETVITEDGTHYEVLDTGKLIKK